MPKSPADEAGLKINDSIQKVDGKDVETAADVQSHILDRKPGDTVKLTILRGDAAQDVSVKLKSSANK